MNQVVPFFSNFMHCKDTVLIALATIDTGKVRFLETIDVFSTEFRKNVTLGLEMKIRLVLPNIKFFLSCFGVQKGAILIQGEEGYSNFFK